MADVRTRKVGARTTEVRIGQFDRASYLFEKNYVQNAKQ